MSKASVKEVIAQLKEFDDDDIVTIFAVNGPPWITEFGFRISKPEEDEENE